MGNNLASGDSLSGSSDNAGESASQPDGRDFLIVGIGASAGGIRALREFFAQVPVDSGIAYVVILHLSPDHDSQLAQVLQSTATIPVMQVTEDVHVEPDHVYVIPPNRHLGMHDGQINVSPNTLIEERRAPIDIFFRTLAESRGPKAIAVILSGTGANGSMGLKRIKEMGGAIFVQNPRESEFSEMPRNAIATDLVDSILPVAEIPSRIIAYKENLNVVAIPFDEQVRPGDEQQALREIFTQLRVRTGHDFSSYKRPTVLRRIERRINIHDLLTLPNYAAFLRENPEEIHALLKDLLISVTNFFRDKSAFAALEQELLPQIIQNTEAGQALRIWVVGCATGEEAYSLAMLCAEKLMDVLNAPKVQIFATDIDEAAIATAREGLYTINDAADVSPERLHRFFIKEGDRYRVRRELREMVLFAVHNVLKDPAFSHLDLVTCRNVLIYFNQTAQERVLKTLHFALNPGGYLFLGTSESAEATNNLFVSFSREHHIFQSRLAAAQIYPVPETIPALTVEKNRPLESLLESGKRSRERVSYGDLHQRLLEQYAPPSIVVNESYNILHVTERAGHYLHISGGELSTNLLDLIRPELRLELRSALYQAAQRQTNVQVKNLQLHIDDHLEVVNIHIRPVLHYREMAQGYLLVLFEPGAEPENLFEKSFSSDEPVSRQLEEELMHLKSQLRATSEQYEIQAEEFKASNEELQAINEELRSSTEELEISKEELQSMNEELTTVNQEHKVKIEELSISNNNFQNLLDSTGIATIFLDRSFRLNLFSPAARDIFNLISKDVGRPLSDITNRLDNVDLIDAAEAVLERLQPIEHEVRTTENRVYTMRVLPYRTADDRINGVVITFFDITLRAIAEEALRINEERMRGLKEAFQAAVNGAKLEDSLNLVVRIVTKEMKGEARTAFYLADPDGTCLHPIYGVGDIPESYTKQIDGFVIGKDSMACGLAVPTDSPVLTRNVFEEPRWKPWAHLAREYDFCGCWSFPIKTRDNKSVGTLAMYFRTAREATPQDLALADVVTQAAAIIIANYIESQERTRSEEALRKSEEQYRAFVSAASESIYEMSADWNDMNYLSGKEFIATTENPRRDWMTQYIPEVEQERVWQAIQQSIDAKSKFELEHRVIRLDGTIGWTFSRAIPLLDRRGEISKWFGTASDITERKRAEEALRESEERLRLMMESVSDYAIFITDTEGRVERWNTGAEHLFGWTAAEVIGQPCDFIFTPEDRAAGVPEVDRQKAQATGQSADERWHLRKDGTRFYVSGVMFALNDDNLTGFVKIARDLTEQQHIEEELRRSREQLEHAVQARTQELTKAYELLVSEVDERRSAEEQVKELLRKVISTQENERRRISRELHDSLGQQLTALRIGLEELARTRRPEFSEQLSELAIMIKRLDTDVDFLAWELRPASLDELGLVPALSTFLSEWSHQFGVAADFHTDAASEERSSYEVETNLYRIAQEALNNVAKHARATQVSVLLENRNQSRVLIIEDNGIGFAPQILQELETRDRGLGLIGMHERTMLIGGKLEIESSPGNGTTIYVRVPPLPENK